ncbi:PREDICTED: lisH domain and HEAT repeat-containing protein KIAA1468 homolog isoform X2 [Ipomoea nil]|uniref:lisH domain and HEAT repeat-containing protein KIAA1468 homolog isoform X2 n=1 Tax=Ipomoea nil TaxID=35883 RepID=UPI0009011EC6|nr:PREDICTED: lisH domain and HEAT repeat-containing protein KIAA1468 homolog isoform X2 [Ipomoea nil]
MQQKRDASFSDLGPLKDNERKYLNCAVKEYLLIAGYRLTAMTFYEEVTDQSLDVWPNSSACAPDALRHYYYQYLSSSTEAAEEKITMIRENESLIKENERLKHEKQALFKSKEMVDARVMSLQKDIKEKENLVQNLKQSMDGKRKELNECRAEITSLKMQIEEAHSQRNLIASTSEIYESPSVDGYNEEMKLLVNEIQSLKASHEERNAEEKDEVGGLRDYNIPECRNGLSLSALRTQDSELLIDQTSEVVKKPEELSVPSVDNSLPEKTENFTAFNGEVPTETNSPVVKPDSLVAEPIPEKMGFGTIQILSDSLPKIVPYVLINHREELLPLIMCAIERHPESSTRDSLTHTLFNLIKRPDEQQRRIIMDACVTLARNVGEMRTETELLPQCWEQINHMYEERRLLVAQSCGELAEFVRPEIRDSLILSIVQQLIEDSATVVREAAAHNLALLLPLFPNTDKYFKVEEMMFQLVCDPSGVVVETTMKKLVPALVNWGKNLDHILQLLLSHVLGSVQRCPTLSGVEGSIESHFRVLGERERWNIDVLLRLLVELLPLVHQKALDTCPFPSVSDTNIQVFSTSLLELYAEGKTEWPSFEWMHIDCFSVFIELASLLPQKEDNLRSQITRILLEVSNRFGEPYLSHIMLPVFLVAVGDNGDLTYLPNKSQSKIRSLSPKTAIAERLATICVLPLLLAGVLGSPVKREQLTEYVRNLLMQSSEPERQIAKHEFFNSVRFLCTYEQHHHMIFNILWEMVLSSNIRMKTDAANVLKVIVPYVDVKVASSHVLPALVTLGSDQNLHVKFASIDAFGAVAQNFKTDSIVDKIRVQMDAFVEDGSHEAIIAVIRALVIAVPHTSDTLRDYLLSKIFQFSAAPPPSSNDVMRRRERVNAFCEAIRALDATDLSASSVRDVLLPTIQNVIKDFDSIDPAHKEALENILKERSGGTLDTLSKVMGAHLGIASSVSSFFGEGGLLGKRESGDPLPTTPEAVEPLKSAPLPLPPPTEDTRLKRIMRGGFTDMLRGKQKGNDEIPPTQ